MESKIDLGEIGIDEVTGFTGKVTAISQYLGGYRAIQLTNMGVDGKVQTEWFDSNLVHQTTL